MIKTGANLYQAVIMEEIKMNGGKSVSKGVMAVAEKFSEMAKADVEREARNGYYNEIRSMVGQQCRKQQGQ